MKSRLLATIGVAVALSLTACGGGSPSASQSTGSSSAASTQPAATATTAPAKPTEAPTVAPTVAPSPTQAPESTPTVEKAEAATATSQPAPSGPAVGQGDIRKMAEAWAAAKSYRITMDSTDGQNKGTFVWEVVRPDREHMKMSMAGQTYEMIRIGQDTYLFFNGKWTKTTAKTQEPPGLGADPSQTVDQINAGVKDGAQLTKGALSAVDGTPCQEWVFSSKGEGGSGTMCVGLLNNLPLQFKSEDGKYTMKFQDWNAPISIQPPI